MTTFSSPSISYVMSSYRPANIVSINPGRKTTGSESSSEPIGVVAGRECRRPANPNLLAAARVLGTDAGKRLSSALLVFRVLFGTLFCGVGVLNLTGSPLLSHLPLPDGCSLFMMACGFLLATGIAARLAMVGLTAMFAWMAVVGLELGHFPQMAMTMGLISLAFLISGPGRYSFDAGMASLLRRLARS